MSLVKVLCTIYDSVRFSRIFFFFYWKQKLYRFPSFNFFVWLFYNFQESYLMLLWQLRNHIWPSTITKSHIWPSMKSKKVVWSVTWAVNYKPSILICSYIKKTSTTTVLTPLNESFRFSNWLLWIITTCNFCQVMVPLSSRQWLYFFFAFQKIFEKIWTVNKLYKTVVFLVCQSIKKILNKGLWRNFQALEQQVR